MTASNTQHGVGDTFTRRASLRTGLRLGLAGAAAVALPAWGQPAGAAGAAGAASASGASGAVAQAAGKGAAWGGAAMRLVSMGSGLTEVVYRLGAEHFLVATDTTSTFPEAAQRTPKVGYLRQLSAEGILALRPSHVLATSEAGPPVVLDQLRAAGVVLHTVSADHSWDEVRRKVNTVGLLPDLAQPAKQLLAELDAQWAAAQQQVAAHTGRKPRVLFVLAHAQTPSVSGSGTAADALIRYIGAENAVTGFKGYRAMTAEGMASAAPDWIMTTRQGLEAQGGPTSFGAAPSWR